MVVSYDIYAPAVPAPAPAPVPCATPTYASCGIQSTGPLYDFWAAKLPRTDIFQAIV
jgi:hypothetical protein